MTTLEQRSSAFCRSLSTLLFALTAAACNELLGIKDVGPRPVGADAVGGRDADDDDTGGSGGAAGTVGAAHRAIPEALEVTSAAFRVTVPAMTSGGSSGSGGSGGSSVPDCKSGLHRYVVPGGLGQKTGCSPGHAAPDISAVLSSTAEGGTIHVAEGRYTGQHVMLERSVTLLGGYQGSAFERRDPLQYVTYLSGAEDETLLAAGADTVIDGFVVENLSDGEVGYAAQLVTGTFRIRDSKFYGSSLSAHSVGILVSTPAPGLVTLDRVTSAGGAARNLSHGLLVVHLTALEIDASRLLGGSAPYASRGAELRGQPLLRNSLVLSGPAPDSCGLFLELGNARDYKIANNTIGAGGGTELSTAVFNRTMPTMTNNVLFTLGTGTPTCFFSDFNNQVPASFQHNLFAGCADLYWNGERLLRTGSEIDQLDGATGIWGSNQFSNSQVFDGPLSDLFVDPDGPDDAIATGEDNDFRLNTDNPFVTQGGMDSTSTSCGPREMPWFCGGSAADLTGAVRQLPFSIGAYEK